MLPPDIDGARILYIELAMRQLPLFVNSRAKAAAIRARSGLLASGGHGFGRVMHRWPPDRWREAWH